MKLKMDKGLENGYNTPPLWWIPKDKYKNISHLKKILKIRTKARVKNFQILLTKEKFYSIFKSDFTMRLYAPYIENTMIKIPK